jgi:5'-3' exonuclease
MNNSKNYVFLCFLLGNDFLPHFPGLNIRSDGIDKILNAFKLLKSKQKNFSLLNNDNSFIVWKNFRKLIEVLCEQEEQSFIEEYKKIKKMSNRILQNKNENQSENLNGKEQLEKNIDYIILNYPSLDRSIEDSIDPLNEGWKNRYYENLFNIENMNDNLIKDICINYVEGLEWTFYYYNSGCPDWNWHYKYNYPPLLNDLIKYIPYFNTNLIHKNQNKNTISPIVQLSYVLPYSSLNLLPENIRKKLINNHKEWYRDDFELKWAFCKYIWESHVELPEIDIENIKKIII